MNTKIKAMRGRGAVAAAAAAAILLLSGCNNAEATWSAPAGASAAPAGATTLVADCTAAAEAVKGLLKGVLAGAAGGGGGDEFAGVRKALTDYATTAKGQAAKVSDPALRAALEKHAAAAQTLSQATDPTDFESGDFAAASEEIDKTCAEALKPSAPAGKPAVRLGGAGSVCALPVAFDLVALWKAKAVDVDKLGELASLARNGPFEVVCEVDAKPAGEIGFLRVYVAPGRKGSPRSHLQTFIGSESPEARKAGNFEVRNIKVTEGPIGGQPAAEVTYETVNKALDQTSKYSAFALNTARGAVVVKLAPAGAEEHPNLLPAFELAKKTLTVKN